MTRHYDLVTFDFDGTLADSADWFLGVLDDVARRHGFRTVEAHDVARFRQLPTREVLRALGIRSWQLPGIARSLRQLSHEQAAHLQLFPGVVDMLDALEAAGVTLAVVSSNSEETVRRVLGPVGRRIRYFRCGSSLFGKPRKIRALRRELGLDPRRVLHVGDETRDVEAANSAGVLAGAVTYGYAAPAALTALKPEILVDSPGALVAAVLGPRAVGSA